MAVSPSSAVVEPRVSERLVPPRPVLPAAVLLFAAAALFAVMAVLARMAAAVLPGPAVATIREVRKTDGSWEIFAAFCMGGALVTAVPTMTGWVTPRAAHWPLLVLVGLISVAAQLLMTYALRFVRAAVAGVIAQFTPIAALAL